MKKENFLSHFEWEGNTYHYYSLEKLAEAGYDTGNLPYSIKVLVENILRKLDNRVITTEALQAAAAWKGTYAEPVEIPYHPARVLMQDFTGVPAVVDLAAMRDVVKEQGKDPALVNPLVPVDLVVDHSIQVDAFGSPDALETNVRMEYQRNTERYTVLKWAQRHFTNFNVVPPNSGICHQVNLEHLGKVIRAETIEGKTFTYPDTLVGTDSHTPMINGMGILGWGVGGIEAEAVLLGQPYYMPLPEVIGLRLAGKLSPGVTTTDLVLTVTELLRKHKAVGKFVEFFGPGMKRLGIPDRATLSNMTPEYGATLGFFPVDEKTLEYMHLTGRGDHAGLVEAYARNNGFFYTGEKDPVYTTTLRLDLASVEPSLAGPSRPQDRVSLAGMKTHFKEMADEKKSGKVSIDGTECQLRDGSVVVAAITSCTNTSNPYIMIGAGLLAKKAVEKGLKIQPYVKTSLAPGSRVVVDYLECAGLMPSFEALGFHLAAFGCTTCIGNSGPLAPGVEEVIKQAGLTAAAVLSGNRNFEARIHQYIRANYLASPLLVVAFALAGHVDIDLTSEPLGTGKDGNPVFLKDIWPEPDEISTLVRECVKTEHFEDRYGAIFKGDNHWEELPALGGTTFQWDEASTYIRKPPFFEGFTLEPPQPGDIKDAKVLLRLGDTITTDHISPAGAIPPQYPAGAYLQSKQVEPEDFNSYGSRRGNHEVMMRGTFANVRIKNMFVHPREGGLTQKFPGKEEKYVFDAAMEYQKEGAPLLVLGGKEYGTGSSRDWAAKGTLLLGIKAVIAQSYERIHRSNLVGMGVLPLVFQPGEDSASLGLDGEETYHILGLGDIKPRQILEVKAVKPDGSSVTFKATVRLDTEVEVQYHKHGGILPYVLRKMLKEGS